MKLFTFVLLLIHWPLKIFPIMLASANIMGKIFKDLVNNVVEVLLTTRN